MTEAEQRAAGVTPDVVWPPVDIEDPADVPADRERAIEAATSSEQALVLEQRP